GTLHDSNWQAEADRAVVPGSRDDRGREDAGDADLPQGARRLPSRRAEHGRCAVEVIARQNQPPRLKPTRGLMPTCSYQKPSEGRSRRMTYSECGCVAPTLPLTTSRSPGLSVSADIPIATSSQRLSTSPRHRVVSRPSLTSTTTNGCGWTIANCT